VRTSYVAIARRRLLGALYVVIVLALVALSVAIYDKTFTSIATVTLKTDHTGNQLAPESDVKERGIIVGYVKSVRVDSGSHACTQHRLTCVSVQLAIDPDRTHMIPDNVSAQILPKTLFGEQYVSLTVPSSPGPPIESGDVIGQDRSAGALETEKVLGDLLPMLTAVQPAQLNATLTALATALRGRGAELGQTLADMDTYLADANPHTKALVEDLSRLGRVAQEYNGVAPDVFATLHNLQTSARTVLAKKQQLHALLTSATGSSTLLSSFLADNQKNLIRLSGTTAPIYAVLSEYSPEYTCLLRGLNILADRADKSVQNHQYRLSAQLDFTGMGKYTPGQEPVFVTGYAPNCMGLPDPAVPFHVPGEYRCLNDGAPLTDDPCAQHSTQSDRDAALGSPAETALVRTLVSGEYGTTPDQVPPIATALAAPLWRGTTVVVKQ
jgi:virulence factor Mce-like protein